MSTYASLRLNGFYLVREKEAEEIVLVQPIMETASCYLLLHHDDEETTFWRKKADQLAEIIEELTDEQLAEYENLFDDDEDEWDED